MSDRIMTLHPEGKAGVNIEASKYRQVKSAIENALSQAGELDFRSLGEAVKESLGGTFEGSIPWYFTTVKLDLEARKLIHCQRKKGGQLIRLA